MSKIETKDPKQYFLWGSQDGTLGQDWNYNSKAI